jgi:hypothetical protein
MLDWLAALAGILFTAVGLSWLRRTGGPEIRQRRVLFAATTTLAAFALAVAAIYAPGQWWNYSLIPGAAFEWYAVATWLQRRREAGDVHYTVSHALTQYALVHLAAMAVWALVMEIRTDGWGPANLFLVAFGASQIAIFFLLQRAKPCLTRRGLLLFERLIPWTDIRSWTLEPDGTLAIELKHPAGARRRFKVDSRFVAPITNLLRDSTRAELLSVDRGAEPDAL